MSPTLRIAILECDTVIPPILTKYGTYGDIFSAQLHAAAKDVSATHGPLRLDLKPFDVVRAMEYPSLNDIDAILITGSRFNAFDDDEWIVKLVEFVKQVLGTERIRVMGVCFGHQIMGRAVGCRVVRGQKWEVSVAAMDLTTKGQEVFGRNALALQQMHRDVVLGYPEDVIELAYNSQCTQGMYKARRFMSVQGHPEFNGEIMRWLLELRHKQGALDDLTFKDGIERADRGDDGALVLRSFLKFLVSTD